MYCTNCGKNLIKEMKYCPYCGTLVENNTDTNPFKKSEETNTILANIDIALPIYYSIAEIQSKIEEHRRKKADTTNFTGLKLFIGAALYVISFFITGIFLAVLAKDTHIENYFAYPALIVILVYILYMSTTQNKEQKKIDELTQQMNVYIENNKCNELFYLPENYRYYIAASYIKECLQSGRAKDLSEALNLYEEQLHRWKMENMQYQIYLANMQQVALAKYK